MKDIQLHLKKNSHTFVLLDYPFASLNNKIAKYIDLTIFIDTPLDIAMARIILRDYTENPISDVKNDLINYPSLGREAYWEMQKNIIPNSDIVIDGALSPSLIVHQLLEELKSKGLLN